MLSSQRNNGSPFCISAVPQSFRLLELPPELLDTLSQPNAPKLHFKSSDGTATAGNAEAVLCTPDKTYHMRQQQTSNGVHMVLPTLHPSDDPNAISIHNFTSISQCTSSLEIINAPTGSAKSTLRATLPLFVELEDANRALPEYLDKSAVFAGTPMSDAECESTWIDLVAFELPPFRALPKRCFRPSAQILLKTWTRLSEIARSEGVDLAGTLRTGTMLEALWDPEDEYPHQLRAALMRRLHFNHEDLSEKDHAESVLSKGSTLDQAETAKWLGLLILQAQNEAQPTSPRLQKDEFIKMWKDSLPEAWREDGRIEILPHGSYAIASDYIRFSGEGAEHQLGEAASATSAANPTEAITGNKRKWHEKFAAARKQGRPT